MKADVKVIRRRTDTTAGTGTSLRASDAGQTTVGMPEEVIEEQVARLALFSIVGVGLWTFGLLLNLVLVPWTGSDMMPSRIGAVIEVTAIITSIATTLRPSSARSG
jgi:hypothetical protein